MLLLWVELKKLFRRGLRLAAGLFLLVGVLNSGLGESMVLASHGKAGAASSLEGTKLVHLQLLGGLFHLHDEAFWSHAHIDDPVLPPGVVQFSFPPPLNRELNGPDHLSGNFTSLSGSDYTSESMLVIAPKYQNESGFANLASLSFETRYFSANAARPTDPYLSPPDKPPSHLNILVIRVN